MKYIFIILWICVWVTCTPIFAQQVSVLTYQNPNLSIDIRLADLLSRMTLEEKVGQLLCPLGWEMYEIHGSKVYPSGKFKQLIIERNAGML